MQRTKEGQRNGYAGRRRASRERNVAGPRSHRPMPPPLPLDYGLRVRNMPAPDRSGWATLVKRMRAATGMSGAELSRRLNVDRATIWRWETGKQKPENIEVIEAFAALFSIDVETALTAAGLRREQPDSEPARPPLDPALAEAQAMLDDPNISPAVKAQVHAMLAAMVDLARQQAAAKPPRRRRAG